MSLNKIKSCLKRVREDESSLCWVEEEIADLLYAIAEHLIDLGKEHEIVPGIPDGWMRLCDFVRQEKFFAASTITGMMLRDPDFKDECRLKIGAKVYVDPIATKEFIMKSKKIQNMLARFNSSC